MFRTLAIVCFTLSAVLSFADGDSKPYQIVTDSETRYIFKASPEAKLPLKNPRTGKDTITKALCCEKCSVCDKWKPVPLEGDITTNPKDFSCPIHKDPLKSTGPIPNDLRFIDEVRKK